MKDEEFLKSTHTSYLPAYEDGTDSVPKRWHIKFRRRGITQKKAHNIQNKAKVWNQECLISWSKTSSLLWNLSLLTVMTLSPVNPFLSPTAYLLELCFISIFPRTHSPYFAHMIFSIEIIGPQFSVCFSFLYTCYMPHTSYLPYVITVTVLVDSTCMAAVNISVSLDPKYDTLYCALFSLSIGNTRVIWQ